MEQWRLSLDLRMLSLEFLEALPGVEEPLTGAVEAYYGMV
jgi:hypothetical protein